MAQQKPKVNAKIAKKHTCIRCDEEFSAPNWNCADGQPHVVESKAYYIATKGLTVFYGPTRGDEVMNKVRDSVTFTNGTYTTTDPQAQEFLDTYPGCISQEKWQDLNYTDADRVKFQRETVSRLEREKSTLMERIAALEAGPDPKKS